MKLICRTVSLAAVAFGLFGFTLIHSSFQSQFELERLSLNKRSAHLAQSIEAAAVNYALQNIPLTDELLIEILAQLDQNASLYDESGASIAGSASFFLPEPGVYLIGRQLYAMRTVFIAGESFQLLTLSDLSSLYQTRRSLLMTYALLYSGMMLVFFIGMLLTARVLTRPIERLAQISALLAAGQTELRAQPDQTLETCALALSFNQMADSLTGQIDRQNRFIANLTHELKTPLTAIIGHADLIRSGRVSGDEISLSAHSILKESQRLNSLSARLIDLILLEQDRIELRPVHAPALVEEVLDALRPSAENRGIELIESCADAVLFCDQTLFFSLLYNLIDNALKSDADKVRISGQIESGNFLLSVSDNGRGMDEVSLKKITEPFYRIDKSRSRAQGGAGLGLALCAQIAALHQALLTFESQPGKGTVVTLAMPGKEMKRHEES